MIDFKKNNFGEIDVLSGGVYVGSIASIINSNKYEFNSGIPMRGESHKKTGNDYIAIGQKLNELNGINPELLEADDE